MKNPHRKKSLQENFTEIFSQEENQNVIVYLKHTQKRQTDCKREPWLVLRHIKTDFKNSQRGNKRKNPAGKYQTLLLLVDIHLYTTLSRKLFIFEQKDEHYIFRQFLRGNSPHVKNPRGKVKNPRGDFDLCHGILSRSL